MLIPLSFYRTCTATIVIMNCPTAMNTLQILPSFPCRASISTIIARPLTVTQSAFTQIAIFLPLSGAGLAPRPIHFLHVKFELFVDLILEILPQLHQPFVFDFASGGIKTIIDERASAKSLVIDAVKTILVITQVAHTGKLISEEPLQIFLIHIDFLSELMPYPYCYPFGPSASLGDYSPRPNRSDSHTIRLPQALLNGRRPALFT